MFLETCMVWRAGFVKPWLRSSFVGLSEIGLFLRCYKRLLGEGADENLLLCNEASRCCVVYHVGRHCVTARREDS